VVPKKQKRKKTIEIAESIDTIQENAGVKRRLKSKGWTKDPKRERYLSELYSKNSGIKIELV